ncbi:8606_t:CDS:2, partial [Cetraspora pellucida]
WVEDSKIKALFKFVNPAIKLLRRSVLSGSTLNRAMQDLEIVQINTMSEDKCSVILIFDSWKNEAEDISRTRSCWPDVIAKTKQLFSEIKQENIQINAVVTNFASAYQVT